MKFKLINPINEEYSIIEQVLTNRGIPHEEITHYLFPTKEDVEHPFGFGEELIRTAVTILISAISHSDSCFVLVDCDADGYTSSALLINYLHDLFPSWVENHLTYHLHSGKQHGLNDCINEAMKYDLIIIPDAGSSDFNECGKLREAGKKVIILDHHDTTIDPITYFDAVVINNQCSDYKNKDLSGVGVTYQFCRYLDELLGKNNADKYLDLVALGLVSDMMSARSIETKYLIGRGLENIGNPFFSGMIEKNAFSIGSEVTQIGVAFYVTPYINAICRSGTLQEKQITFESMLEFKAKEEILSTKRGHSLNETETILTQALRTVANVKNRQTREQDKALETIEEIIKENNLLNHKVLLILLKDENKALVPAEIRGLIANKFMAKYNKPCCILSLDETRGIYEGSARGCDKTGVRDFKSICENTRCIDYVVGHPGAFGLGICSNDILSFIARTDAALEDVNDESVYLVDFIYKNKQIEPENILQIADMKHLWGKDVDEVKIAIEHLTITSDMISLMSPDKRPTLKIVLPNGICLIKFGSSQEELDELKSSEGIDINVVGTCNRNEWMGKTTPQVLITEYEINNKLDYYF